ncbi:MAG: hypothetical protein KAI66_19875 [Lentisphaeria bacterium]|nr:hypothetical protein [Lentisphaeria bacterium]
MPFFAPRGGLDKAAIPPRQGDRGDTTTTLTSTGGGGGAVGRIRLEWVGHGARAPIGVSGTVSLGEASVQ